MTSSSRSRCTEGSSCVQSRYRWPGGQRTVSFRAPHVAAAIQRDKKPRDRVLARDKHVVDGHQPPSGTQDAPDEREESACFGILQMVKNGADDRNVDRADRRDIIFAELFGVELPACSEGLRGARDVVRIGIE